jgi:hypothetical protein
LLAAVDLLNPCTDPAAGVLTVTVPKLEERKAVRRRCCPAAP